MSILKKPTHKWLQLAIVPLFSMAVLVGCGSDDDDGDAMTDEVVEETVDPTEGTTDPTEGTTDPVEGTDMAGDADGNGLLDVFQTTDAAADANGNLIADVYEVLAPGAPFDAADTNENGVDDSYEVALTGGDDANGDGIDDLAAGALENGGPPVDGDVPAGGDEVPAEGEDTPAGEGETETDTPTPTGNLNLVNIGDEGSVGTGDLSWDGTTLSGQVNIADGVDANSVAIYTGIEAARNGEQAIVLNGSSPTFFVPTGISADDTAVIADNIVSGNLFVQVELADGGTSAGILLLDTVTPVYTELLAANTVPAGEAFTKGAAFLNLNTETGDFSAAVTVSLDSTDGETITAAHIHVGGVDEDGAVIQPLENPNGDTVTWTATGTLSTADLASVLEGNTYFNVHRTDGTNFIRGQITGF